MSLFFRRTTLLRIPGVGVVKITPPRGKAVKVDAPEAVEITDRKGRPMDRNRRKKNGYSQKTNQD